MNYRILWFLLLMSLFSITFTGGYLLGKGEGSIVPHCPEVEVVCPEPFPSPPATTATPKPSVASCLFTKQDIVHAYNRGCDECYELAREDWECKNVWKVPESCKMVAPFGVFQCLADQP